ncbi:MAG TPA: dihydrofolate reductase family protein [Coriobacteriia bacterium]|nr:dihydrofolate reductase family protein [Coriobacteriia bacterium]
MRAALEALGRRGLSRLLVETGPRLFSALYDDDLIDELVMVTAGRVFGPGGVGMYPGGTGAAGAPRAFRARECSVVGEDAVTVWRRSGENDA